MKSVEKALFPDYNKMRPPQQKIISMGIEAYFDAQVDEVLSKDKTLHRNKILNDLLKLQAYVTTKMGR